MANIDTNTEPFDWNAVAQAAGVPPEHVADPQVAPPQAAAPAGSFDREAFKNAWQSQPNGTNVGQFVSAHPEFSQGIQVSGDRITLPTGERLDATIDSGPGGLNKPAWTGLDSGGGQNPSSLGNLNIGSRGNPGAQAVPNSPQGMGNVSGFTPYTAPGAFNSAPMTQPGQFSPNSSVPTPGNLSYQNAQAGQAFTPQQQSYYGTAAPTTFTPEQLQAQTLQQPGALNYQSIATPESQQARQVSDPSQLQYERMGTPQSLSATPYTAGQTSYTDFQPPPGFVPPTETDMLRDPGYQFRLKQGADLEQNSAAAKGVLRTGNTAKALIDYGQNAASQEYGNVFNRALQTQQNAYGQANQVNQENNAGHLGAFTANENAGLAANNQNNSFGLQAAQGNVTNQFNAQNANNSNALGFGQANIQNGMNAIGQNNAANLAYGGQNFQQGYQATNANNQTGLAYGQQNIANTQNTVNQNNANTLAFGNSNNAANGTANAQNFNQGFAANQANNAGNNAAIANNNAANQSANQQNFNQGFAVNQANNAGNNGVTQGNFSNQLAAQGQGYNQAANTYGLNANTSLAGQQQGFNQALATHNTNTGDALNAWNVNNGGQLAWVGSGQNQQQIDNGYNLGLLNNQLGQTQANNSYNLGLGGLNLNQNAQAYNQDLSTNQNQFGQLYSLANLGLNATNNQVANNTNLTTGIGNSQSAGTIQGQNAWNTALGNIGNNLLTNQWLGAAAGTRAQGV